MARLTELTCRPVKIVVATVALTASVAAGCSPGDPIASTSGERTTADTSTEPTTTAAPTTTTTTTAPTTTTTAPPELPGGGRTILPDKRVVAFYGNSQSTAMGVLGETGPEGAVDRLTLAAAPFDRPDRPVIGAFELIVSVAQRASGTDGDYSEPTPPEQIQPWIDAARDNDMLVILDVQPGRSSFVDEVKRYEPFLLQPNVSLALDPEWRMGPNEAPGDTIGSVDAAEVVEVGNWLSDLVTSNNLPQKLLVIHQFTADMITNRGFLTAPFDGLATVLHIDGFGGQQIKAEKYAALSAEAPIYNGFKLFYDEDTDMFEPAGALALEPSPDLITYQ